MSWKTATRADTSRQLTEANQMARGTNNKSQGGPANVDGSDDPQFAKGPRNKKRAPARKGKK